MKSLFKKSLLVLMVAFIAVFTLGVTNKVNAEDGTWTKVTDASDLAVGNQVVIVASTDNYALSTNQKSNNRGAAAVTKSGNTITFGADVQVLTLEAGTTSGSFAFYTGSGYLYAASSSSNNLKTQANNNANGSWNITITSAGVATIKATGTYTRNVMQYNPNNGSPLFACYGSASQKAIEIYKFISASSENPTPPTISLAGAEYTQVDETVTLTATTENTTGVIQWSSSNENVATVDQTGKVTAKSMGKTTITATVEGVQDTLEFIVYPIEGSELTIVEALQVCEYTGTSNCPFVYSVSGNIKTIDYSFNESNNNISLTITDGTHDLYSYKMSGGSDLEVGNKIKITGTLVTYNNKCEFSEGSTYEKLIDETLEAIKGCLNNIDSYMSFAYKYTHDVIQKEVVTTLEAKMLYTDGTTTNMKADVDNSSKVGLDSNLFIVKAIKNKPSNNIGLNKDGTIRLYANSADGNGNELEISTKNGKKIVSIEIEFASIVGSFTVNGINGEKSKTTYNVDDTKVTIKNTTIGSSTQVHIKSIIIKYESNESTGIFENVHVFTDTDFRIKCGVAKDLANIEGIESYGVKVSTSSKEEYLAAEYNDATCLYAIISLGNVLTDLDRLDVEFTVQAYVVVEGIIIDSDSVKTMSLRDLIETYYEMPSVTEQIAPLYNLIQSLN